MLWFFFFFLSGFLLYIYFKYDSYFKFLSSSFFLLICIGDACTHISCSWESVEGMLGCNRFCSNLCVVCYLMFLEFVLCIADPAGIICFCVGLNSYSLRVMLLQINSLTWLQPCTCKDFYDHHSSEELFVKIQLQTLFSLSLLRVLLYSYSSLRVCLLNTLT